MARSFKREFTATCLAASHLRDTSPPRSPSLNAFVKRFHGSVLHLHYRTAFYTDADLQAWVRFYNFERPHRRDRSKGGRPPEIVYPNRPDLLEMKGWDSDEFIPQSVRL